MTCEQIDDCLLDFVEGELSTDRLAAVRGHLDGCPACADKARETRKLVGDLGAARSIDQRAQRSAASQDTVISPSASTAPAPPTLSKLSLIGDYEIIEELGRGGMGVVYRARQITLNRIVALKVLSGVGDPSDRAVERFLKEAQAAARLHHTNIVPIYGQGHESGHFYYAMELVDGQGLDKWLRTEREANQPVGPKQHSRSWVSSAIFTLAHIGTHGDARDFKRIARQIAEVAEALQHAHDQGVIHRDIKPQNLLIGRDDKLHITDFGLARILDEPGLTRSTETVGTPAYMAPEQIRGGGIDHRVDVYALGVTLYEMLTLQRPFLAETYDQMLLQVLKREPRAPRKLDPHVPIDLETICLRAIEKEPAARFPAAREMARELRRYADDYPIVSRRVSIIGKTARWVRRNPARASALVAGLLALLLGSAAWGLLQTSANQRIDAAFNQLLKVDYDDPTQALDALGWARKWGGDRARAGVVLAFGDIKRDTRGVIRNLTAHLRDHPDDTDAHYLLAWAYARLADQGETSLWPAAQTELDEGDRCHAARPASVAGSFFQGQSLSFIDPAEAYKAFDAALLKDAGQQALLHQGRVANAVLYVLQDPGYWGNGKLRLESACFNRPNKAYPRYLLSICHRLWGMYNRDHAEPGKAAEAFAESLKIARQAQEVERDDPRGYLAEAEYDEAIAEGESDTKRVEWLRAALEARRWMEDKASAVKKRNMSQFLRERWAYPMRIHFWLGENKETEAARANRYPEPAGIDRSKLDSSRLATFSDTYDADEAFYCALIARSAGDEAGARKALYLGARCAGRHAEELLKIDVAFRLCGFAPPPKLLAEPLDYDTLRSARWTREWLEAVVRYYRDEITFDKLQSQIAVLFPQQYEADRRRAKTGAEFFRGVKALAAGRRGEAREALTAAWKQNDFENYCFRAKFLRLKMEQDPRWPGWLPETAPPSDAGR